MVKILNYIVVLKNGADSAPPTGMRPQKPDLNSVKAIGYFTLEERIKVGYKKNRQCH